MKRTKNFGSLALMFLAVAALTVAMSFALVPAEVATAETPVVSVWDGTSDTAHFTGGGTYFEVSSAAQLKGLADCVNTLSYTFAGATIKLTADIDLNGYLADNTLNTACNWYAIGSTEDGFQGVFDGNGHTISNMYTRDTEGYTGLFRAVNSGTIKNLTLDHVYADDAYDDGAVGSGVGILVGAPNEATITNVALNDVVFTAIGSSDGLFCGQSIMSTFTDCTVNNCTVTYNVACIMSFGCFSGLDWGSTFNNCSVSNVVVDMPNYNGVSGFIDLVYGSGTEISTLNNCGVTNVLMRIGQDDETGFAAASGVFAGLAKSATIILNDCYTDVLTGQYKNAEAVYTTTALSLIGTDYTDEMTDNNTQYAFKGIAFDGVESSVGVAYAATNSVGLSSSENPTTAALAFMSDISNVSITLGESAFTDFSTENNILTINIPAEIRDNTNVFSVRLIVGFCTFNVTLATGIVVPDYTLSWNATPLILSHGEYYSLTDTAITENKDFTVTFATLPEGATVNASIDGGTVTDAVASVITLSAAAGVHTAVINYSYSGATVPITIKLALGLIKVIDNVYYTTETTHPWTLTSGTFAAGNSGVDDSTSGMVFYVIGSDYFEFNYAVSCQVQEVIGQTIVDGEEIDMMGNTDYMKITDAFAATQYIGNHTATSVEELTYSKYGMFGDSAWQKIYVNYIKNTAEAGGLDIAYIKDVSTTAPSVNVTANYNDSFGNVQVKLQNGTIVDLPNGVATSIVSGPTVEVNFLTRSGVVYSLDNTLSIDTVFVSATATYADSTTASLKKAKFNTILSQDTTYNVIFCEPLTMRSKPEVEVSINGADEQIFDITGGAVTFQYSDTNIVTAKAPVQGWGEQCYISINGEKQADPLPNESGFYYYYLGVIENDVSLLFTYTMGDAYKDAAFSYDIRMQWTRTAQESIINADSKPIDVVEDALYPFEYNRNLSLAIGDTVFVSGNKGKAGTISNIGFTVYSTGVLTFEYYVSSEATHDYVSYTTDGTTPTTEYITGDVNTSSGTPGWQSASIPVALDGATSKTINIAYIKDGSLDKNDDIFGIRNVGFYTQTAVVNYAASVAEVSDGITATADSVAFASGDSVPVGASITMTFSKEGYDFIGWKNTTTNTIVSENAIYKFQMTTALSLTAVVSLHISPDQYVAKDSGNYYLSLADAFADNTTARTVTLIKDTALTEDTIIPSNITLLIPYSATDTTGTAIGTTANAGSRVSWVNEAKYLYRTLTIAEGGVLNVEGKLIVGGVQHYPDQSAQGHTSGAYSQIINNGTINVQNNGVMKLHGLVKGSGYLNVLSSGTLYEPFLVNNYAGGTNTEALYNANQFPFVQYATVNVQCKKTVNYGAKVIGMTSLYFWSSVHTQDVVLINTIENKGSEGALIWMHSGSSLEIFYEGDVCINGTVGNINLADVGHNTILVKGEITAGEFYLDGYGSGGMVLSLPYTYAIILGNGTADTAGILNIIEGRAYKLMPGAAFLVNNYSTLNVDGTLYVYDGLIQSDKSGKYYPSSATFAANGWGNVGGRLMICGTMNVNGTFAGIARSFDQETGGKIVVSPMATLSATITDGCSGGYTDNTTVFDLTARVFGPSDMNAVALEQGKTYVAYGFSENYHVTSFSVTSAARVASTTETVDAYYYGGFLEYVNATTAKMTRTFYIGEAVEGVVVNLGGNLYTTDAEGKFTATFNVTVGENLTVSYFTKDKDGSKTHTATVTFGIAYDTLTEVVKSAELKTDNVYTRVYNKNNVLVTDFTLNSVVSFYGSGTATAALTVANDDAAKYTFLGSLTSAEYPVCDCSVNLYTVTAEVSSYVANCDAFNTQTADTMVSYANARFAEYTALKAGRLAEEITFLDGYLATNNTNNDYLTSVVKSVAVTSIVTYGDETAYATVTLVGGGTVTEVLISKVSYKLENSVISGDFCYNGTFAGVSYKTAVTTVSGVKQRTVNVDILGKITEYNDDIAALTYSTADGAAEGDDLDNVVKLSTTAVKGSAVGDYAIKATSLDARYKVVGADGIYTVSPRSIVVTVANHKDVMLSKTANISFSVTQSNSGAATGFTFVILQNSITIATVSSTGVVTLEEGKTLAVGDYTVQAVNHDSNYNMLYSETGTLKIVEDNDYYTVAFNYGRTSGLEYNGTAVSVGFTVSVKDDSSILVDYTSTITLGDKVVTEIRAAGTYTVTVNITDDDIDYTDTFTVAQREVDIRWSWSVFYYNGNEQKPSFELQGVLDGETVGGVYGNFSCTNAGEHTATLVSLSGADAANYKFSTDAIRSYDYVINAYEIRVIIADKTSVYGGELVELTASTENALIGTDILANIVKLSKEDGNGVKQNGYAITGECVNDNYSVTFTPGTYDITARPITVTIADKSSSYGDAILPLTATVSAGSIVAGDTAADVYSLNKETGNYASTFAITGTAVGNNYDITFTDGVYTIAAREITVKIGDANSVYGDANATIPVTLAEGFALGFSDTLGALVRATRAAGTDAGKYNITATALYNLNYDIDFSYTAVDHSVYTVSPREINVKATDVSIDDKVGWNSLAGKFGYTVTSGNVITGDELNVTYKAILSNGVELTSANYAAEIFGGEHVIEGSYANDNYSVTFTDGVLTVTKRQIGVTGIVTEYVYTGSAISVFDWENNVTDYRASAVATSFRADLYKGSVAPANKVDEIVGVGDYVLKIVIVHTNDYEFKADAVTEYEITVSKKDVSSAISVRGCAEGGIVAFAEGLSFTAIVDKTAAGMDDDYDVTLVKALTFGGSAVTSVAELGTYVYTATIDDANFSGSKAVTFRVVENVSAEIEELDAKLTAYEGLTGVERTAAIMAIRDFVLAFSADDKTQIEASEEYQLVLTECAAIWTDYVEDCTYDLEVASKAAGGSIPVALLAVNAAVSAAAWFTLRKLFAIGG